MRRYMLALLAALVLAFGAFFLNRRNTNAPPPLQNRLHLEPRDLKLRLQSRQGEHHAATNVHYHSADTWLVFGGKSWVGSANAEADGGLIGRHERDVLSAYEGV